MSSPQSADAPLRQRHTHTAPASDQTNKVEKVSTPSSPLKKMQRQQSDAHGIAHMADPDIDLFGEPVSEQSVARLERLVLKPVADNLPAAAPAGAHNEDQRGDAAFLAEPDCDVFGGHFSDQSVAKMERLVLEPMAELAEEVKHIPDSLTNADGTPVPGTDCVIVSDGTGVMVL